jgi:hypothetical protein
LHSSHQEAIAKFCSSHEEARQVDMNQAYKHLMYDDKYKMLYCFVPKGGSTSVKPVFQYLHRLVGANQTVSSGNIHGANTQKILLSRLPHAEREKRLKTYYKILILRHPLERMMSAYKDKLEVPLSSGKELNNYLKGIIAHFLSANDHTRILKKVVSKGKAVPYVNFTDFMMYLSGEKLPKLDQHLMPIYLLCNPCAVNYTFYGNVHSLTNDIHQALQEVGAPEWLYKERIEHSKLSVSDMMELYFGQLSPKERTRLKEEFKRKTGYSFEAAPKVELPLFFHAGDTQVSLGLIFLLQKELPSPLGFWPHAGNSQMSMSFNFRMGRATVHSILLETCSTIWSVLSKEYVKSLSSPEDWIQISRDFLLKWNFPNCIGAIDGKHIVIQAPKNSGSTHYNYKGTFSVVLMAVRDANYSWEEK